MVLIATPAAKAANLPALWPTFSQPTTIVTVDLRPYGTNGIVNPDSLAQTTLMGAYNQLQGNTRLFLILGNEEAYWLSQLAPSSITVSPLSWTQTDPNGALKAMLASYGTSIRGAIVYDPANPESVNVATTMAGIDDAMVITPAEISIVQSYGVPILANLASTVWIGSNSTLVNNTTINKVANPSGGGGTSGWSMAYGGSGATLTASSSALQWTVNGSLGHDDWVDYNPALTQGYTYLFSAQVSGSGQVFLDAYDGVQDWQSSQVTLTSTPQTLQLAVTIPASTGTPQIQLRTHGVTAATVNIENSAVIFAPTADEEWAFQNLFSSANQTILAILNPGIQSQLRDYIIASKMFVFYLSPDHADQTALMTSIVNSTPHNTPIMGYIYDEGQDVPFISSSTLGHFLNASDFFSDASIWASLTGPTTLSEPAPAAVAAQNGTIYVGSLVSDGDNAQYVEGWEMMNWTGSQFLGAVPEGWTMPPAMIMYAPTMLAHYNSLLPQSNELAAGPSGIGYATAISGSDLSTFGTLTGEGMNQTGMSTVTDWFLTASNVVPFVQAAQIPHDTHVNAYSYALQGSTVLDGQTVSYWPTAQEQLSEIITASSGWSSGAPLFIESLVNGWGINPDDMLWVAQRLQSTTGHNYVFLTPSELALTEKNYYSGTESGLPATNTQAASGAQLLAEYPNNLVWNGSGLDGQPGLGGGWVLNTSVPGEYWDCCTSYNNQGAQMFYVPANAGSDQYVYTPTPAAVGVPYTFSVNVAGSGEAYLDVYDGSSDHTTAAVTLGPNFQTLRLTTTLQSATAAQIQVRVHSQTTPTTVYFQNNSFYIPNWQVSHPGSNGNTILNSTTYQNGPAMQFQVAPSLGHDEWMQTGPPVAVGSTYTFSVDVAGTGTAFLDAYTGSSDVQTSPVTLTSAYQTLKTTATIASYPGPLLQVRSSSSSGGANIYVRNASVVLNNNVVDFASGVESGDPQPTWTNTIDTSGGGISNVSNAVLTLAGSGQTHGGSNALLYSGTAGGGATNYAYSKVFSPATTITVTANTRLSYWVFPQSPKGLEANASSSTGVNSTCVAIDMIFADGSTLRDSGVKDQYGNQLHPAHECAHLQLDQWNYVTANMGALAGKVISRINVGYDLPGVAGMYRGYIDDISITN